jgi:mono/diheme cytochrome c family protein
MTRSFTILAGLLAVATLAALPGCDSGEAAEPAAKAAVVLELKVEAVPIAPEPDKLGRVAAVAELDESFVAFGDRGAIAVLGGLPGATDDIVKAWSSGAAVPAADGTGSWPIGVDDKGRLLRLRDDSGRVEDISTRYGLAAGEQAKALVKADDASFVIVLDASVIVVDVAKGTTKRFDTGPLAHVSATTGRLAGTTATDVRVIDLALGEQGKQTKYALSGSLATAFDPQKKLVVLTEHGVHLEGAAAGVDLDVVVERPDVLLHGLASTPARVWFGAGTDLWALEQSGAKVARGATTLTGTASLVGSPTGDVWILGDTLSRVTVSASAGGDEGAWTAEILPIYQTVCQACHSPTGSARIDLSSYSKWMDRRAVIRERIVEKKTMPPLPTTLTPEQIDAIRRWTE